MAVPSLSKADEGRFGDRYVPLSLATCLYGVKELRDLVRWPAA